MEQDEVIPGMGQRIAEVRKALNWTQVQLSDFVGSSRPTVAQYERGRTPVPSKHVYKICKHADISADYLFFGVGALHDQDILRTYRNMSPGQKEMVRRMMGLPPLPEKESLHAPPEAAMQREDEVDMETDT